MTPRLTLAPLALALTLLTPAAQAHDLWLAKVHGEQTLFNGHSPFDTDGYDPNTVVEARAYKNGKPQLATIVRHHNQRYATIKSEAPGLVGLTRDGGFWVKTKDGKWHNQSRNEISNPQDIALSLRSLKMVGSYLTPREPVTRMGYDLEIVPASNPAKLKQGDPLEVQVFYMGKPLAGAKINTDLFDPNAAKISTDTEGKATLKVNHAGYNAISASHSVPYPDSKLADQNSLVYTLSYVTSVAHH
ncbi:MAG: DUF4198 domain-containing protein [Ottowia sp.]